jgi:methanogen homoaconitase large subunit
MPQTLVEKILSSKIQKSIEPGEVIEVEVDRVMVHDGNAPLFFRYFSEDDSIFGPERVVVITDHFCPPSSEERSEMVAELRRFIKKFAIHHYYEFEGICHQIMPEEGFVVPGSIVIGIDSHSTLYGALGAFATGMGSTDIAYILKTGKTWLKVPSTIKVNITGERKGNILGTDIALKVLDILGENKGIYKALQFCGRGVKNLSMDSRMTLSNFSHETGAKVGIFPVDDLALNYLYERARYSYDILRVDKDAVYEDTIDIELSDLEPLIALPHSQANVEPVTDCEGKAIHQAFIGSCANGRMEDLRAAAKILDGRKIHEDVRMLIIPSSNRIFKGALKEGLIEKFIRAGAVICNPSCGPCAGIDKGILGTGDVCISTSNRNFKGRMGSQSSEIYLASAATVAASALRGEITAPPLK